MKRVLLPGDSIRMGYCERVSELLIGKAVVCWPKGNGRFTLYAIAALANWAGEVGDPEESYADAVHFKPEGYQALAEAVVYAVEKYI